jgi:hypothetical protein
VVNKMSDTQNPGYKYIFHMGVPIAACEDELEGILKLLNPDGTTANEYRATSSRKWKQFWGSWRSTGGLLPPNEPYSIDVVPSQSNLDGIRGDFHAINPYEVKTIGDTRAAFGLHNDANREYAWGSMGCIVPITAKGWDAIRRDLRAIHQKYKL